VNAKLKSLQLTCDLDRACLHGLVFSLKQFLSITFSTQGLM